MDPVLERRALALFEEALDWPPETRDERLSSLLLTDPELAERLKRLLGAARAGEAMPTAVPAPREAGPPPPSRVGVFQLTELIGAGGMGAVYRGERDDGLFDQTVAVKLMRPGLVSPTALAQFALERAILARLQHPNISQLFDGGVDPTGHSYIVMELIEGQPIGGWAQMQGLDLRATLALLAPVCDAVQHAHQANVVHADIKPGNLLVDARGQPKLLDFGIAQSLTEAGETAAPLALTLPYASPARRAGERATPADDVYALGALIHELIAGEPPPADLPLPAPSRTAPPDRAKAAAGDLDAVVAKATDPDPKARYASVSALADDLTRWLERYPVRARPTTWRHAAAKLVERRPWASTAAGAAVVGLLAATTVTSLLYARAERERAAAEQRFDEVRSLARFVLFDVVDGLEGLAGGAPLRRRVAETGRAYLQRLEGYPRASDDLALEIGAGYGRVGRALSLNSVSSTGDTAAGAKALASAEDRLRKLYAAQPARSDVAVELAKVLTVRAAVSSASENDGKGPQARFDEAFRLYDTVLKREPGNLEAAYARWNTAIGQGDLWSSQEKHADIVRLLTDAQARGRRLPTPPAMAAMRPLLEATTDNSLGDALWYAGRPAEGLIHYQAAAATLEAASRAGPADVRVLDRLAMSDYNVSSSYSEAGRMAESLAWADRGVAAADELAHFDDSPRSQRTRQILRLQRAVVLSQLGRHDEAVAEARRNADDRAASARRDPSDYERQRAYAAALRPLAETYARAGRKADACRTLLQARDVWAGLEKAKGVTAFDRDGEVKLVADLSAKCP